MKVLDLFSGIGGFSLGLERAGMTTVAFCEIEPYCKAVLKKHWPDVPQYDDIRTLTADRLRADGIDVDLICGGFPCQDISVAGKGAGIADGTRSGLWSEYARLVGEIRPRYVIVENVAALLGRGISRVLGDLSEIGYDAEWHVISAADVGAPHRRERVWIVAYPKGAEVWMDGQPRFDIRLGEIDTDANSLRPQGEREAASGAWSEQQLTGLLQDSLRNALPSGKSGGVVDGVSNRAHRLRGLGNSVVPQIPEIIGRAIMEATK